MFDPVFELGFLLFIWVAIGIPAYGIAKKLALSRSPMIVAVSVPIAGMVGFFGTNATGLIPDGISFPARMAIDALVAVACIALTGWAVSRYWRRPSPQP